MSLEDDRSKGFWRSLFGRRSAVYWRPPRRGGGWPNARIRIGRRVYVVDAHYTPEQLLEGLEESDTVDALLKGRLEEVRNILQDILESH